MVPLIAIIGTVFIIAFFVITLIMHGTMNESGEWSMLLNILLVGLGLAIAVCLTKLYLLSNVKTASAPVASNIVLSSCPNYWVSADGVVSKVATRTCYNHFKDKDGNMVYIIDPSNVSVQGKPTQLVSAPMSLNTYNSMTNTDKCKLAEKYAWSEAYAKCGI